MSLQGTLDTFALADVIRLLAATSKTGHLRITSPRGAGGAWLDAGLVVGIESPLGGETPETRAFELLRLEEGSFAFESGERSEDPEEPTEVEDLLTGAEVLLAEWREIVAVVPSLEHRVALTRILPAESVPVDQAQWDGLVAIGGGTSVRAMGDDLGQDELAASRTVRALVEAGLVEVLEPSTGESATETDRWTVGADLVADLLDDEVTALDEEDDDEVDGLDDLVVTALGDEIDDEVDDLVVTAFDDEEDVDVDIDPVTGTYGPVSHDEGAEVAEAAVDAPVEEPQGPRPTWSSLYPQHRPATPAKSATRADALSTDVVLPVPEDPALLQHLAGLRPSETADGPERESARDDDEADAPAGDASPKPDRKGHEPPKPVDPAHRGALLKFLSSVRT
ncbi:MAG TPA: DUF4388 domain-containing protein [Acidimicrobiales bacterium]|nr:DUF4388 domain-containing protein [Acidimicrobiales bacterium]